MSPRANGKRLLGLMSLAQSEFGFAPCSNESLPFARFGVFALLPFLPSRLFCSSLPTDSFKQSSPRTLFRFVKLVFRIAAPSTVIQIRLFFACESAPCRTRSEKISVASVNARIDGKILHTFFSQPSGVRLTIH